MDELPFCDELSIEKILFKRYAEAGKSCIKSLFEDLLDEIKGFKYQIIVKVFLRQNRKNRNIGFAPVYFNSTTKTVINSDKYFLIKYVQKILYRINNWINESLGWVTESIDADYVKMSTI